MKLVGIDYLSIEQFKKAGAPAHRALLAQGVIIIEGLNLADVNPGTYEMYCLRYASRAPMVLQRASSGSSKEDSCSTTLS